MYIESTNPALLAVLQEVKLCEHCARRTKLTDLTNPIDSCNYCSKATETLRDTLWLHNCLCIKSKEQFSDKGDSGAVLFEIDQNIKFRGFGIMFGVHFHSYRCYALASSLDIALETLADKIFVSNLRLLSNYGERPR